MTKTKIREKVMEMVHEYPGVEAKAVTDESKFSEDLGLDSLDHVELVMEMEEEFHVEVTDESAEDIKTVGDLMDLIEKVAGGTDE